MADYEFGLFRVSCHVYAFDSAMEKSGLPFLDVIDTHAVEDPLGDLQEALTDHLHCQVKTPVVGTIHDHQQAGVMRSEVRMSPNYWSPRFAEELW